MEIVRIDPRFVAIRHIPPFEAGMLRQIPGEADPGEDKAAHERLYSKPVEKGRGKEAAELNEEWEQYIEPELRHLFQSAAETVANDLKNLRPATPLAEGDSDADEEESYELHIPVE